jgi:NADPH:quinone reductase-like Zn-dependent oxidoreductase
MKAAVIHDYGGPEALSYEDMPDPIPGPGEVLIQVAAAGINPVDTYQRSGKRKDFGALQFPAILGWDLSGRVEILGEGVDGFAVGDKVLAWAYHTYAELCVVKASLLAKVPQGLNLVDAAALPLVTLTGSQAVSVAAGVKAGQRVLVSGASGSVGRAAVFTAKELGANVIAGVSQRRLSEARDLGADEIVALDDETTWNLLAPVDVVVNTVRGATAEQLMGKVKSGGIFASVAGVPVNASSHPEVRAFHFASKQNATGLQHLAQAVGDGRLAIPVSLKLPMSRAAEGHLAVEKGGSGKILLIP